MDEQIHGALMELAGVLSLMQERANMHRDRFEELEKRISALEANAIPPSEMPGIRRGRL